MTTLRVIMPYTGDISVNKYLGRRKAGGDYIIPAAEVWGMCLRGALNSIMPIGYDPTALKVEHPFDMDIEVKFPRRFSKRSGDATNFDKYPRDVVAATLGVDDAGTSSANPPKASYSNGANAAIIVTVRLNGVEELPNDDHYLCLV